MLLESVRGSPNSEMHDAANGRDQEVVDHLLLGDSPPAPNGALSRAKAAGAAPLLTQQATAPSSAHHSTRRASGGAAYGNHPHVVANIAPPPPPAPHAGGLSIVTSAMPPLHHSGAGGRDVSHPPHQDDDDEHFLTSPGAELLAHLSDSPVKGAHQQHEGASGATASTEAPSQRPPQSSSATTAALRPTAQRVMAWSGGLNATPPAVEGPGRVVTTSTLVPFDAVTPKSSQPPAHRRRHNDDDWESVVEIDNEDVVRRLLGRYATAGPAGEILSSSVTSGSQPPGAGGTKRGVLRSGGPLKASTINASLWVAAPRIVRVLFAAWIAVIVLALILTLVSAQHSYGGVLFSNGGTNGGLPTAADLVARRGVEVLALMGLMGPIIGIVGAAMLYRQLRLRILRTQSNLLLAEVPSPLSVAQQQNCMQLAALSNELLRGVAGKATTTAADNGSEAPRPLLDRIILFTAAPTTMEGAGSMAATATSRTSSSTTVKATPNASGKIESTDELAAAAPCQKAGAIIRTMAGLAPSDASSSSSGHPGPVEHIAALLHVAFLSLVQRESDVAGLHPHRTAGEESAFVQEGATGGSTLPAWESLSPAAQIGTGKVATPAGDMAFQTPPRTVPETAALPPGLATALVHQLSRDVVFVQRRGTYTIVGDGGEAVTAGVPIIPSDRRLGSKGSPEKTAATKTFPAATLGHLLAHSFEDATVVQGSSSSQASSAGGPDGGSFGRAPVNAATTTIVPRIAGGGNPLHVDHLDGGEHMILQSIGAEIASDRAAPAHHHASDDERRGGGQHPHHHHHSRSNDTSLSSISTSASNSLRSTPTRPPSSNGGSHFYASAFSQGGGGVAAQSEEGGHFPPLSHSNFRGTPVGINGGGTSGAPPSATTALGRNGSRNVFAASALGASSSLLLSPTEAAAAGGGGGGATNNGPAAAARFIINDLMTLDAVVVVFTLKPRIAHFHHQHHQPKPPPSVKHVGGGGGGGTPVTPPTILPPSMMVVIPGSSQAAPVAEAAAITPPAGGSGSSRSSIASSSNDAAGGAAGGNPSTPTAASSAASSASGAAPMATDPAPEFLRIAMMASQAAGGTIVHIAPRSVTTLWPCYVSNSSNSGSSTLAAAKVAVHAAFQFVHAVALRRRELADAFWCSVGCGIAIGEVSRGSFGAGTARNSLCEGAAVSVATSLADLSLTLHAHVLVADSFFAALGIDSSQPFTVSVASQGHFVLNAARSSAASSSPQAMLAAANNNSMAEAAGKAGSVTPPPQGGQHAATPPPLPALAALRRPVDMIQLPRYLVPVLAGGSGVVNYTMVAGASGGNVAAHGGGRGGGDRYGSKVLLVNHHTSLKRTTSDQRLHQRRAASGLTAGNQTQPTGGNVSPHPAPITSPTLPSEKGLAPPPSSSNHAPRGSVRLRHPTFVAETVYELLPSCVEWAAMLDRQRNDKKIVVAPSSRKLLNQPTAPTAVNGKEGGGSTGGPKTLMTDDHHIAIPFMPFETLATTGLAHTSLLGSGAQHGGVGAAGDKSRGGTSTGGGGGEDNEWMYHLQRFEQVIYGMIFDCTKAFECWRIGNVIEARFWYVRSFDRLKGGRGGTAAADGITDPFVSNRLRVLLSGHPSSGLLGWCTNNSPNPVALQAALTGATWSQITGSEDTGAGGCKSPRSVSRALMFIPESVRLLASGGGGGGSLHSADGRGVGSSQELDDYSAMTPSPRHLHHSGSSSLVGARVQAAKALFKFAEEHIMLQLASWSQNPNQLEYRSTDSSPSPSRPASSLGRSMKSIVSASATATAQSIVDLLETDDAPPGSGNVVAATGVGPAAVAAVGTGCAPTSTTRESPMTHHPHRYGGTPISCAPPPPPSVWYHRQMTQGGGVEMLPWDGAKQY